MNKLISIIMPVKNGSNYIEEALTAIKNQNMNIEIIVVDDGSCDKTYNIAKSHGCVLIHNEQSQGPVKAKNQALKIAKGDYIMFHDHDDIMNPSALFLMYNEIAKNYSIGAVQAKVKDFLSPDCKDKNTIVKPEPYYGLFTGAILIRKSVFDTIGLFDESVTAGEIIDWQSKMDKNGFKIKKLNLISTNRRLHNTNFGKTQQKTEFKDYAALLRAKIMGKEKIDLINNMVNMFRSSIFAKDRRAISDEEHSKNIREFLANLDTNSYQHAFNLVEKLEKTYTDKIVSLESIYSNEELEALEKVKNFEKKIKPVQNGYQWNNFILPIKLFEPSVFYYRHGLDTLKTKDSLKDKAIIDAGSYICDSALIFRDEFKNAPIYCFEPVKSNVELAQKTIKLNGLQNITVENYGLGDKNSINKIKTYDTNLKNIESVVDKHGNEEIKIITIDSYVKKHKLKVGLIKTDVEGFEQKLLMGAKQTIREQKPILLISIYHKYDDFYKIKPTIESWNLGYKFDIFQGIQNSGDITVETLLIAELR